MLSLDDGLLLSMDFVLFLLRFSWFSSSEVLVVVVFSSLRLFVCVRSELLLGVALPSLCLLRDVNFLLCGEVFSFLGLDSVDIDLLPKLFSFDVCLAHLVDTVPFLLVFSFDFASWFLLF